MQFKLETLRYCCKTSIFNRQQHTNKIVQNKIHDKFNNLDKFP